MIWNSWLNDLAALPANAPEWEQSHLEEFIQHVQSLAQEKRASHVQRVQEIEKILLSLQIDYFQSFEFILPNAYLERWSIAHIESSDLTPVHELLVALRDNLDRYQKIEQAGYSNAKERRQHAAQLDLLEEEIIQIATNLIEVFDIERQIGQATQAAPDSAPAEIDFSSPSDPQQAEAQHSLDQTASVVEVFVAKQEPTTNGSHASPAIPSEARYTEQTALWESDVNQLPLVVEADPELAADPEASSDVEEDQVDQLLIDSESMIVEDDSELDSDALIALDDDEDSAWDQGFVVSPATETKEDLEEPERALAPEEVNVANVSSAIASSAAISEELATSHLIAQQLVTASKDEYDSLFNQLIEALLKEQKIALAYHFVSLRERRASLVPLPSHLIHALVLAEHIQHNLGDNSSLLKQDYAHLDSFVQNQAARSNSERLLLLAASLRPALLAPDTGAPSLLQGIEAISGLNQLYDYSQAIAKYGQFQHPLDMGALYFVKNRNQWQAMLENLRQEVKEWHTQAWNRTNKYKRAGDVWRQWQKQGGIIHRMLTAIEEHDINKQDAVRADIKLLSNNEEFRLLVIQTDRVENGRNRGSDIQGPALKQIQLSTEQAISFARRWIQLLEQQPEEDNNFFQQQATHLRERTRESIPKIEAELNELEAAQSEPEPLFSVALNACRHALKQVDSLFSKQDFATQEELPIRYLLNSILLQAPVRICDDQWELLADKPETEQTLLQLAQTRSPNWSELLRIHESDFDYNYTAWILEAARMAGVSSEELSKLEQSQKNYLQDARHELKRLINEARNQVENTVANGLLRESHRHQFIAEIQQIEYIVNQQEQNLAPARKQLIQIYNNITQLRQDTINSVRQRLTNSEIPPDDPNYKRIVEVLDKDDILAANDYIDMVQQGQTLPEDRGRSHVFEEFYPKGARDILKYLEDNRNPISQLVHSLERRSHGHSNRMPLANYFDRRELTGTQARSSAKVLEAWFRFKQQGRLSRSLLDEIMNGLDFKVLSATEEQSGHIPSFQLETIPVHNKTLCPVWQYGSRARGHYRLLCAWNRPTENQLISALEENAQRAPTIIFYFGRMTETRRKEFARLCRERHLSAILIDDLLLIYLCSYPAPRMPHLFDCTLPFSHLDPYSTTAGLVPTEVFYGRQKERTQIIDPMGSCFIYGGRQLGKTALLRDIERELHKPEEGTIAIWIDLKAEGIGNQHPIDSLWQVLGRELSKHTHIQLGGQISAERLIQQLQAWIEQDTQRRILLLLDEADSFLAQDGRVERHSGGLREAFSRSSQIKGLMDRTERRVKVVFAGLHNVKRTTRQSNHPLAHYGEPICIGPLLEEGEWREARQLIERPLESLGFRFESPDLVTRILSQTNYYPSLIQLYGKQLVKFLTSQSSINDGPPYTITSRNVEEVYQSKSLREDIRQRFNLTIQLDQRYEVIAYVVALGTLEDDGAAMTQGFSVDWIREQALAWWLDGFRESATEDLFLALLDEMVGLGILREVKNRYYALRSPNVALLMGTLDEIERELVRSREPAITYERETFRSPLIDPNKPNNLDLSRRNPLTSLQVSELSSHAHGVRIICGTKAAKREEIASFLSGLLGEQSVIEIDFCNSTNDFSTALAKLIPTLIKKDQNKHNGQAHLVKNVVILVPPNCPWSEQWLKEAWAQLGKLKTNNIWFHIAFIADPACLYRMLNDAEMEGFDHFYAQAQIMTLAPWHDTAVRQWFDDCNFPLIERQDRAELHAMSGNWPIIIEKLYQKSQGDLRYWRRALDELKSELATSDYQQHLFEQFELPNSLPVHILKVICELDEQGELSIDDLIGLVDTSREGIELCLRWAHLLSFALPTGKDTWRVDPLVCSALKAYKGAAS
jgi:hypothetical protein